MIRPVLIAIGLLFFFSCGNRPGKQVYLAPEEKMTVIEVLDRTVQRDHPKFQFNVKENKAFGFAGCNTFSAPYTLSGNTIKFNYPIATEMWCEGKMDNEKDFFSALASARSFSVKDRIFMLYDDENNILLKATYE
ncbi:hypothetical protein GCM10009117_07330 [Gangjinia marincola]|uniref:DUF306 domain-containing protein n=1 Tax=Gangjinia marincola TaxID=578463 RepID=A0ABN1MER6_9FLAO